MYVYDGNRSPVAENWSTHQALAQIDCRFSTQAGSTYYVQVSSDDGTSGSYTLLVKPLKLYDSFEPNDDFTQAKSISLDSTIDANIMDANDTDFYVVKVGRAGQLTATITNGGATLHPHLYVYDGNRSSIAENWSTHQALAHVECPFSAQVGSTYYVQVSSDDGTSGAYKLTVK